MKLMIILILVIILIAGCTQQPTTSKQTQSEIDIGPGRTGEFTFEYKDPIGDVKPYMELPEGYHNFGDITKHIDIKRFSDLIVLAGVPRKKIKLEFKRVIYEE